MNRVSLADAKTITQIYTHITKKLKENWQKSWKITDFMPQNTEKTYCTTPKR
nr:hypothetical protein [Streptococcus pluranimalium]